MYKISITNLNELEKSMKKSSFETEMVLKRALEQSLTAVTNMAKANAPFKTGTLRRSIHSEPKGLLKGEVSTATPYAKYVELGTKPHIIVPKKAKALAFRSGGSLVFAKKVKHPGFKGRFYMRKTSIDSRTIVQEIYKKAARTLKTIIEGGAIR